jgi:hypothetical protein
MVRKSDLSIHPTVKRLPEDRGLIQSFTAQFLSGDEIHDPLEINPGRQIIDGRHRFKGALPVDRMTHLPCIINADSEGREATIVVMKRAQRCHWTKGALAYALLPEFEIAVQEAVARRAANLKKGGDAPENRLIGFREGKGSGAEEIAGRYGISVDLLQLARKTASLFEQSDKAIEKWLFANPHERELWDAFGRDLDSPWTKWRTERLVDMGESPKDPATAAIIPENYREIYEEQLFAGEMGLGQINKALGSILATKGGKRSDLDADSPALHIALCNKVESFNRTMWKNWSQIPVAGRAEVIADLSEGLKDWPKEAKTAVFNKLKGELAK